MIHANLIHLSYNLWEDQTPADDNDPALPERVHDRAYHPALQFDEGLWRRLVARMAEAGMNRVVLDLGDGVAWQSRPEIAVEGAWPTEKLRGELTRCRDAGLEPIPKLNFSATHDVWLGEYARKVSTKEYYAVCRDLIAEAVELFDGPRLFHLGMDEETARHQRYHQYVVIRQGGLWWSDLNFLVEQVQRRGSTAWVWSDILWGMDAGDFERNMPKSVVQSNWYYGEDFDPQDATQRRYVEAFVELDRMGYRQIPTGSNWSNEQNYPLLVDHCRRHVDASRVLGYLMTSWKPTLPSEEARHVRAIEIAAAAHGRAE